MSYQLDPKNFMFGTAFREGIQQSQDNKRRNALLDLEKQQFGLKERRVGMEEKRYAQSEQALKDAQERERIGRRALMKDPSLLQEWGIGVDPNDPEDVAAADGIFSQIAQAYGGFEGPQQADMPSDYQKYLLAQQDPGFGSFLQQQQRPPQEPDAIRTLRLLASNPELAALDEGRRNKPPAGYRPKEDGSGEFEPIPGGPADLKLKAQAAKEFEAKKKVGHIVDAEIRNIDLLIGSEDGKTKEHPGIGSMTGSIESKLPTIRQQTANAVALLESLKSKASINALREIRSGGSQSIGQITEREWPRLEGMKVALSEAQSKEQFIKQLKEYRDELKTMKRETDMAEAAQPSVQQAPQSNGVMRFDANGDPIQ